MIEEVENRFFFVVCFCFCLICCINYIVCMCVVKICVLMLIDVGIYNSDLEFYNEGDLFLCVEWYGMVVFFKVS